MVFLLFNFQTMVKTGDSSGGVPVVVLQHSAQSLTAGDTSRDTTYLLSRFDQPILQALMIPLLVILTPSNLLHPALRRIHSATGEVNATGGHLHYDKHIESDM